MAQVGCVQFIMQLPRHFTILLIKTFYFIIYIYILGPLFWECQTFLLVRIIIFFFNYEPEKMICIFQLGTIQPRVLITDPNFPRQYKGVLRVQSSNIHLQQHLTLPQRQQTQPIILGLWPLLQQQATPCFSSGVQLFWLMYLETSMLHLFKY